MKNYVVSLKQDEQKRKTLEQNFNAFFIVSSRLLMQLMVGF